MLGSLGAASGLRAGADCETRTVRDSTGPSTTSPTVAKKNHPGRGQMPSGRLLKIVQGNKLRQQQQQQKKNNSNTNDNNNNSTNNSNNKKKNNNSNNNNDNNSNNNNDTVSILEK
ncbi:unnamed protein product [Polarella glacialis]|uniref:Uncharacterized protein n=1 Tax=Polarella glacialis TaxID=89957 RepID=A0A813FPE5_POLGL|nr:unnamed protein product [Polarella glacialis]